MGKKSSNAPAPDPRLVEAQIRSMGIQDDAIQRILANSEALMPVQREQLQFGLDSARQAYEDSRADRDWMLQRRGQLGALQDRLVLDANAFNTEERRNELRGEAYADVNQAFAGAQDMDLRAMGRMGINPSSGRALALGNQTSIAQAAALASAGRKVSQAARAEGYALTDRAANALAGYPSMGMQATGAGAGFGMAGLGLANQGLAGVNSGFNSAGGLAGQMGDNAAGMYSAMGTYKNGQDQIAASRDPFNTILGAAAGMGTAWGLGKLTK